MPTYTLYRLYGRDETDQPELLYIGVTMRLNRRITEHRHYQPWGSRIARELTTTEDHPTRRAASDAERDAITATPGLFNHCGQHSAYVPYNPRGAAPPYYTQTEPGEGGYYPGSIWDVGPKVKRPKASKAAPKRKGRPPTPMPQWLRDIDRTPKPPKPPPEMPNAIAAVLASAVEPMSRRDLSRKALSRYPKAMRSAARPSFHTTLAAMVAAGEVTALRVSTDAIGRPVYRYQLSPVRPTPTP